MIIVVFIDVIEELFESVSEVGLPNAHQSFLLHIQLQGELKLTMIRSFTFR